MRRPIASEGKSADADEAMCIPTPIDWPAVITESAPILTEPQHISFRNMAPVYQIDHGDNVASPPTPTPPATSSD